MHEGVIRNRTELYDLEYPVNFYGDVDYITNYAMKHGRYVLDLGAGTGRVSFHLLQKGFNVVAVDNDTDMIDAMIQKGKNYPEVLSRLEIVKKSMADYRKNNSFNIVVVTGNTFTSLLISWDQLATLENIKHSLSDDGIAIVHVCEPNLASNSINKYTFSYKFREPRSKLIYERYVMEQISASHDFLTYHFLYKVFENVTQVAEFCNSVTTKIIGHREMENLIQTSGLDVQMVNDNFTDNLAGDNSFSRVYVIGKK